MHDLRYDAHAPDERTRYDMPTVKRIDPADLRTVQPVDLRTPQARVMDAEARDLRTPIEQCPLNYQVDYWTKAIHEAALRLREVSEKMQAQGGAA